MHLYLAYLHELSTINSSLSFTGVRTILKIEEYSGELVVLARTAGSLYKNKSTV